MRVNRIWAVYFSPCGRTKKAVMAIADKLNESMNVSVEILDYTLPESRKKDYTFSDKDIVIWGTPVYAGRIPNKLLPFIKNNFTGNEALAIPVVVFGNRNYDDALVELRNELEENGFHTIAGAGIAAQHAFTDKLGNGRPNDKDIEKINRFAEKILIKLNGENNLSEPVYVKGQNPPEKYYRPKGIDGEYTVFLKARPKTDIKKCISCGVCAEKCPMGVINPNDKSEITGSCIKCHACINSCEQKAKYFDDEAFISHKLMLEKNFTEMKNSEFFL